MKYNLLSYACCAVFFDRQRIIKQNFPVYNQVCDRLLSHSSITVEIKVIAQL